LFVRRGKPQRAVHVGAQSFSNYCDVEFPEMWVCLGRRPRIGVRALAIAWRKHFPVVLHDLYLCAAPRTLEFSRQVPCAKEIIVQNCAENQNAQIRALFFVV
jgi:hypothetical protein